MPPNGPPAVNGDIETKGKSIILFDGVCSLCNGFVHFILDRDPQKRFLFAPLQSRTGQYLLDKHKLPKDLGTVVLVDSDQVFTKSSAILRVTSYLSFPWPLLYTFQIVPWFIRDTVYDCVAGSRYQMFGKEDACRRPTPETRGRFLDLGETETV
eukprot:TRINITY_DN2027_c0_g1_i1.p1 TRINITY_DN2027_c0_g1~~TRINITY_DN2027_c0_g1_i1.p1  ORF type:complete len:154 (+),score=13.08 TRINITY_DN2027_c0_g1_i1:52-513(+)